MGKREHINIRKASETKCSKNNKLLSTFHSPPTIFRCQILCAHTNIQLKIITVLSPLIVQGSQVANTGQWDVNGNDVNYFWVISLKTKPLALGCTRSFRAVWEMIIMRATLGVWLWGWQPQHHHPLKAKKLIQGCSISENKFIFKALYLVIYFSQQCSL